MFAKSGLMTGAESPPPFDQVSHLRARLPSAILATQPDNSPVANPMFDEADQPILVTLSKQGLNVAVEYPVDPPLPDTERERIQRLMLVRLRSETVAEAKNSDS